MRVVPLPVLFHPVLSTSTSYLVMGRPYETGALQTMRIFVALFSHGTSRLAGFDGAFGTLAVVVLTGSMSLQVDQPIGLHGPLLQSLPCARSAYQYVVFGVRG